MKTAILLTGAMRSFDKTWNNHKWMLWRHFPGASFYCVTEDDADAWKTKLLNPNASVVKIVKQPEMQIPPGCPNEWTPGKPYMHEPYHISVDPRAVLGQLWMLREGWRLYQEANDPADLIIRCRPDLWFHSFEPESFSYGKRYVIDSVACVPWWGRFGGCNDRFALLGPKAAEAYFCTWDRVNELIDSGCPIHPETMVASSILADKCEIVPRLKAEFSTLRKSGEMRPPEITMIDLAHAAMR